MIQNLQCDVGVHSLYFRYSDGKVVDFDDLPRLIEDIYCERIDYYDLVVVYNRIKFS